MAESTIGWLDITKIVLASGLVSALVVQAIQWFRESRKEKVKSQQEVKAQAIKLVAVMEGYFLQCYQEVQHHERLSSEYQYYENKDWCRVPELDTGAVRLEVLPADIQSKIAWIGTESFLFHMSASEELEGNFDPEDYAYHRISIVGYFGYAAAELAGELRAKYQLPALMSGWSLEPRIKWMKQYWVRSKKDLQKELTSRTAEGRISP